MFNTPVCRSITTVAGPDTFTVMDVPVSRLVNVCTRSPVIRITNVVSVWDTVCAYSWLTGNVTRTGNPHIDEGSVNGRAGRNSQPSPRASASDDKRLTIPMAMAS